MQHISFSFSCGFIIVLSLSPSSYTATSGPFRRNSVIIKRISQHKLTGSFNFLFLILNNTPCVLIGSGLRWAPPPVCWNSSSSSKRWTSLCSCPSSVSSLLSSQQGHVWFPHSVAVVPEGFIWSHYRDSWAGFLFVCQIPVTAITVYKPRHPGQQGKMKYLRIVHFFSFFLWIKLFLKCYVYMCKWCNI